MLTDIIKKTAAESRTEQVQIVLSGHINGAGRLFGGQLLAWIDVVAAVVARRHSGCDVTTASIDKLSFKAPAFVNDTIVLIGELVFVGRTSMEIKVDTYIESYDGRKTLTNTAYTTLVALDKQQKPAPVPGLIIETEAQKLEWEAAAERRTARI